MMKDARCAYTIVSIEDFIVCRKSSASKLKDSTFSTRDCQSEESGQLDVGNSFYCDEKCEGKTQCIHIPGTLYTWTE